MTGRRKDSSLDRGNWTNRYGTDTFDSDGNVIEKGDVARLTPAQRKRVRKQENRTGGPYMGVGSYFDRAQKGTKKSVEKAQKKRLFGRKK